MSWMQDLASFAKRLVTLEDRVETNTKEIEELRKDLKTLTGFTQKVAYAVKRNEERSQDRQDILVRDLKIELLELERRLSGRELALQAADSGQKRLPDTRTNS